MIIRDTSESYRSSVHGWTHFFLVPLEVESDNLPSSTASGDRSLTMGVFH